VERACAKYPLTPPLPSPNIGEGEKHAIVIETEITVSNRLGLHARASAKLVQLLAGYKSAVHLSHRGREINAKSIMGLMLLAAGQGSVLAARVEGPDEDAATAAMIDLFARNFDEGE